MSYNGYWPDGRHDMVVITYYPMTLFTAIHTVFTSSQLEYIVNTLAVELYCISSTADKIQYMHYEQIQLIPGFLLPLFHWHHKLGLFKSTFHYILPSVSSNLCSLEPFISLMASLLPLQRLLKGRQNSIVSYVQSWKVRLSRFKF